MPGRNARLAFQAFYRPFRQSLNCITRQQLLSYPRPAENVDATLSLGERGKPAPLMAQGGSMGLWITFQYRIVRSADYRGPWRVATQQYAYTLFDASKREIASYQWVRGGRPHLHVSGQLGGKHFETGRIAIEQAIRTAITEFDVKPLIANWQDILTANQLLFEQHRSWPRHSHTNICCR